MTDKKHINTKLIIAVSVLTVIVNCIIVIAGTVLFDKMGYCLKGNEILTYDDLFYDFSDIQEIDYKYDNYSDKTDISFKEIESLFKSTEFKALPRLLGRTLVLFQNKYSSAGKIQIVSINADPNDLINLENNFDTPKIGYARIFKFMGNFYLYYYPNSEDSYSTFAVCKILNKSEFTKNEIINAKAHNYTYPEIFPSYYQSLKYSSFVKFGVLIVYLAEVSLIYCLCVNKKKLSKKHN